MKLFTALESFKLRICTIRRLVAQFMSLLSLAVFKELPLFATCVLLWGSEAVREYEGLLRIDENVSLLMYIELVLLVFFVAAVLVLLIYNNKV